MIKVGVQNILSPENGYFCLLFRKVMQKNQIKTGHTAFLVLYSKSTQFFTQEKLKTLHVRSLLIPQDFFHTNVTKIILELSTMSYQHKDEMIR